MIKAGEWVIVASTEEGDVGCQRVARVTDEGDGPEAQLNDCTSWGVETGQPLTRAWKGHVIRPADEGTLRNRIPEVLARIMADNASAERLAKLYAVLLEAERFK